MLDCLFCKIIAGEVPGTFIYEDDIAVVFMDIFPITKGHCLIVPKKHSEDITDSDDDILAHLLPLAKKIGRACIAEFDDVTGFNVHISTGSDAGQVIFHPHIHIIPRRPKDGLGLRHPKNYPNKAEPAELIAAAEDIKRGLH